MAKAGGRRIRLGPEGLTLKSWDVSWGTGAKKKKKKSELFLTSQVVLHQGSRSVCLVQPSKTMFALCTLHHGIEAETLNFKYAEYVCDSFSHYNGNKIWGCQKDWVPCLIQMLFSWASAVEGFYKDSGWLQTWTQS